MEEIGQLLWHAHERTTAIYAKVDQARLAELARPCTVEQHVKPWRAERSWSIAFLDHRKCNTFRRIP
jgi:hypothetical protein